MSYVAANCSSTDVVADMRARQSDCANQTITA